jgi:DNA-binding protein H-NS
MCKHVAAVLYGIGARLDEQPELVFKLRAVDHAELIVSGAKGRTLTSTAATSARLLDGDDLSALFGLEMGVWPEPESQDRRTAPRQKGDDNLALQSVKSSSLKGLGSNRGRQAVASGHKEIAPDRGSQNPHDDAIASNAQPAVQDVHGRLNTHALNTTKHDSSAANRIGGFPTPVQTSSMATLLQLQKQMSQLQSELERVRRAEAQTVIAHMQKDIATYGITAADLGFSPASSSTSSSTPAAPAAKKTRGPGLKQAATASAKKTPGIAKFRDPKSGKTWTGQGKPPGWIAGKKDRTPFLIAAPNASPMIATEQVSAPVKKASKKLAAKKSARSAAPKLVEASAVPAPVAAKKAVAKKAPAKKAAPTKMGASAKKVAVVAKKAAQAKPQAAKKAPATKLASKSATKTANASAKAKAPKAVLPKATLALSQPAVDAAQGTLPLDASAA